MSADPDRSYRDPTRIIHMLQALERIEQESREVTKDDLFFEDRLTRAIVFDFIVLGEAANNVSEEYCSSHPEVPWAEISGFRHKLVHDYSGIDFSILWDSMVNDVPALLPIIRKLAEEFPGVSDLPENIDDFL